MSQCIKKNCLICQQSLCKVDPLLDSYNFCVCATTFVYALQLLCMCYGCCECATTFVYVLQLLSMLYNFCVCATTVVNVLQLQCMCYNFCVCDTTFVYELQLLYLRHNFCVCATTFNKCSSTSESCCVALLKSLACNHSSNSNQTVKCISQKTLHSATQTTLLCLIRYLEKLLHMLLQF